MTIALAPKRRPLGLTEDILRFAHSIGAFVVAMGVRFEGTLTEGALEAALERLVARHPLLRVKLVKVDGEWCFVEMPDVRIPVRRVPRASAETVREVMEAEVLVHFAPEEAPRVRIVLVEAAPGSKEFDMVLAADHAVCDGASVVGMLREIAQDLATFPAMPERPRFDPLPSIDQLVVDTKGVQVPLKEAPQKQAYPLNPKRETKGTRFTRFLFRELGPADLSQLAANAKAEGVTVNAALTAAALQAMASFAEGPQRMGLVTNVSLRGSVSPPMPMDFVASAASYVNTFPTVDAKGSAFWDVARSSNDEIKKAIASGEPERRAALRQMKWWERFLVGLFAKTLGAGIYNTLAISNSGRFDLGVTSDRLRIKAAYPATGQHIFGSSCGIFVWTIDGAMQITFACPFPFLSDTSANAYADAVLARLRDAAKPR